MAKQAFALERGQQNRLEVSWSGAWKDVQIALDGTPIGSFETKRQLEAGGSFTLPDGSQLQVKLERRGMDTTLRVLRNGVPLRRGASSPAERVALAAAALYFIAVVNIVVGFIADFWNVSSLVRPGGGFFLILGGLIFACLARATKAKQSLFALVLGSAVFALDSVLWVPLLERRSSTTGEFIVNMIGLAVMRTLLFIPMLRGVPALNALIQKPKTASWTDRRARGQRQKSTPEPADPGRRARRLKVTLGALAVIVAIGVAIGRFAPRTHAATLAECEKAASDDEIDRCLTRSAVRDGDSSFCKAMHRSVHFETCAAGMDALMTDDGKKCQRMEDAGPRDACIANLVGSGSDPQLCELIEPRSSRQRCISNAGDRWPPHQ